MGLPKIDLPIFETKLISTGRKKIKYRPFTVKEEKILLIAQESDDIDQVVLAIKQIINNCCSDVDVDELPMFDLEYLLMQIRGKSVNNLIKFQVTDPDTEQPVDIEIDVEEIKVVKPKGHKKEIKVGTDSYLVMKYPKITDVTSILTNIDDDKSSTVFDVMLSCIDSFVQGDSVYSLDDYADDEVLEFVESFSTETIEDIKKFFETVPVMRFETEYTNANGDDKKLVLEGVETFFI